MSDKEAGFQMIESGHGVSRKEWELASAIHAIFQNAGIDEQGKLAEAKNMIINVMSSTCSNKEQAIVLFYAFVEEMSQYDENGAICTKIIEFDLFSEIYRMLGFSVNSTYQDGFKINNFNAYNFDIFSNEIFPMYVGGAFGPKANIIEDMAFPDRFLNILFRSMQSLYRKDLRAAKSVVGFLQKLETRDHAEIEENYKKTIKEIDRTFKNEVHKIVNYLAEADQKRIFDFLTKRLGKNEDYDSENSAAGQMVCENNCAFSPSALETAIQKILTSDALLEIFKKDDQPIVGRVKLVEEKLHDMHNTMKNQSDSLEKILSATSLYEGQTQDSRIDPTEIAIKLSTIVLEKIDKLSLTKNDHTGMGSISEDSLAEKIAMLLNVENKLANHDDPDDTQQNDIQIILEEVRNIREEVSRLAHNDKLDTHLAVEKSVHNVNSFIQPLVDDDDEDYVPGLNEDYTPEIGGVGDVPPASIPFAYKAPVENDDLVQKINRILDAINEIFDQGKSPNSSSIFEEIKDIKSKNTELEVLVRDISEQNLAIMQVLNKMSQNYEALSESSGYIQRELQREIEESIAFRESE